MIDLPDFRKSLVGCTVLTVSLVVSVGHIGTYLSVRSRMSGSVAFGSGYPLLYSVSELH